MWRLSTSHRTWLARWKIFAVIHYYYAFFFLLYSPLHLIFFFVGGSVRLYWKERSRKAALQISFAFWSIGSWNTSGKSPGPSRHPTWLSCLFLRCYTRGLLRRTRPPLCFKNFGGSLATQARSTLRGTKSLTKPPSVTPHWFWILSITPTMSQPIFYWTSWGRLLKGIFAIKGIRYALDKINKNNARSESCHSMCNKYVRTPCTTRQFLFCMHVILLIFLFDTN